MAKAVVQECMHGLTDNCKVTKKVTTEDFRTGEKEVLYWYDCFEHHKPGTHLIAIEMPMPS